MFSHRSNFPPEGTDL